MGRRPVRRALASWLLAFAVAVSGCQQAAERGASLPEGYAYAPMQWPVAWRQEENSLVLLHLERGVDQSGGLTLCSGSGVYQSPVESGGSALLFPMSSEMCQLDLRPETTGGAAGMATVVVAERDSLKLIDLGAGRVSGIALPGLSLRQYGAVSPNGGSIAFIATPTSGDTVVTRGDCLYTTDVGGSDIHQVTCFEGKRVRSSPSWSPDMTRIALSTSEITGGPFFSEGSVVNVETGTGQSSVLASGYFPSWSPDGRWIAYLSVPIVDTTLRTQAVSGGGSALRIVSQSGADDLLVLATPGSDTASGRIRDGWAWAPIVWSPDASRLAFSRLEGHGSQVWEVSVTGTGLQRRSEPEGVSDSARR
jgi:hypothetical protein